MRVSISFPSNKNLNAFANWQRKLSLSYEEIEGTKKGRVESYDNDYHVEVIGEGEAEWEKSKALLRNWQQFPFSWTKIYDNKTRLKKGEEVIVLFRLFGLWWFNGARIIYAFDEPNRFGFAYGTLTNHIERGEECFWLEKDENGVITYHIKAFSRPRFWLVRLGYFVARRFQKKFVLESMEQMRELVKG